MAKHWCAFLGRVGIGIAFLASFGNGGITFAQTAPVPGPTPSLSAEGLKFMELPAFDAEAAGAPIKVRVGDLIPFVVKGLPSDWPAPLELSLGPDSRPWMELGALPQKDLEAERLVPPAGEFRFGLVALKPGVTTLPSLAIKGADGKLYGRIAPLSFEADSNLTEKDREPAPPRPPVSLRFPWWVIDVATVDFIVLLSLRIYGLVRYSRRSKALTAATAPPAPLLPEDQEAIDALTRLEAKKHGERGEFKPLYFGASEIIKHYMSRRFGFDAEEQTTSELLEICERERYLSREDLQWLSDYYDELDSVKFADRIPALLEAAAITERAREFVARTRRPAEVTPRAP